MPSPQAQAGGFQQPQDQPGAWQQQPQYPPPVQYPAAQGSPQYPAAQGSPQYPAAQGSPQYPAAQGYPQYPPQQQPAGAYGYLATPPQATPTQYPAAQSYPPYPPQQQPARGYGYLATPPQATPTRSKRRRVALVATLVVVLVLTIGSVTLFIRNRGTDDPWSQAWLDGFEEAWSLKAPTDSDGQTLSTALLEDRLVRVASTSSTATITVYDVSGDAPEQLWETEQDITNTVVWPALWDRQIIIENTFIDLDSQARSDAPWDADARVTIMSNGAVACVDTTCQFWSSPSKKLWEVEFPTDTAVEMWYSRTDDYSIVSSIEYEDYFVVDLKTGNMNRLDGKKYVFPYKLNDGWLTYEGNASTEPTTYHLYELDGTPSESFKSDHQYDFSEYPWSPTPFTREQARLWLEDLDLSWAPATYTVSQTDSDCDSITINRNDVELGETNALTNAESGGECTGTSPVQALTYAGYGQVQSFNIQDGDKRYLMLVDMLTGRSSELISLGSFDDFASYGLHEDLLLVTYQSGKVVAYQPNS
ncbi:Hypothetical protein ACGLYG10_0947 [Actinomyces glycerinitolerans]|uniref:Uncharacterized protein n=1 Tax=Actinomyces glycerinitolerans TaxID=1892869 RepID=A0A1M4RXQ2_9ACTO|nr:Hypothetical protein ACGLYG10_0947 [Actinomyces glycerinitolerans]